MSRVIEVVALNPAPPLAEALRTPLPAGVRAMVATDGMAPPAWETDYGRILRERRGARGWDEASIGAALRQAALRAVARLLRREIDALLLAGDQEAAAKALALLDPLPGAIVAPLRLARGASRLAWLERSPAAVDEAAREMEAAARWLTAHLNYSSHQSFTPVLVAFAGGRDPHRRWLETVRDTLAARTWMHWIELYSPLFYDAGRLCGERIVQEILARIPSSGARGEVPLVCAPSLPAGAIAAASPAVDWTGTLWAAAEHPAASVGPEASSAEVATTLRLLGDLLERP